MKIIVLSQGQIAKVSDRDYAELNHWKWCAHKRDNTFYAVRNVYTSSGKQVTAYMHRVILNLMGYRTKGDHKDGDGLNNQRSNLRPATDSQSMMNRGLSKNNTSGVRGVTWDKAHGAWLAQIGIKGKHINLGRFKRLTQAAKCRHKAEVKYHGKFRRKA